MLKGIDVSSWQGIIDFTKVKAVKDFFIMKATEGVGFTDPKFSVNQAGARKSGMLIGYYCFTRPDLGNTVEAEVDYLLKTIGELKAGEVIFLDYEVSYAKPVAWCKAWLDYLAKRLNGYKGLVYLNQSLLNGNDWTPLITSNYGLWLAKYDYDPDADIPATKWGVVAFRQYSNKEVVPGITGGVDANVFYGDKNAYLKYGYNPNSTNDPVITPPSSEEIIAGLEKKVDELTDEIIEMRKSRDKWKSDYKELSEKYAKECGDKIKQIESLQSTNAELTSQLALAGQQVKTALEEKKIAVEALQPLKDDNKILTDKNTALQKEVDRLNAKLAKNLKGYKKGELIRAYFGIYPEKY